MRKETVFLIVILLLFSTYLLPIALNHHDADREKDIYVQNKEKVIEYQSLANDRIIPTESWENQNHELNSENSSDGLFVTDHEKRVKAYLSMDEDARGRSLSEYSEMFYPFSSLQRQERLALAFNGLTSNNRMLRDLNLQLLGSVTPIELVPEFITLYERTEDIELKESLVKLLAYTIGDAKEELNSGSGLSEHEDVKNFFLSNIGSFPAELEEPVFDAIEEVFTEEEVINIVQQGYFSGVLRE